MYAVDLHVLAWAALFTYWRIAAFNTKATTRRDTIASRLSYFVLLFFGVSFFWPPRAMPFLRREIMPDSWALYWFATALLFAGIAFAIWARVTLGRNWSNAVTLKEDHELIQSGPYRYVRHPIYTGLLTGILGSALARDEVGGLVAVFVIGVSFWIKLRREEKWMHELFGSRYAEYARHTYRLIPFIF